MRKFSIKKIVCAILTVSCFFCAVSCSKKGTDGFIESGELVVLTDSSEIRLGIYDVDTLNPIATKSESVQKIMNIVYEPLFTIDEDCFPEPVLAKSYTLSPDGMQIHIDLKDGVKWHDGTNLTADDVVYTLSRISASEGLYKKLAERIHSFTAASDNQVIITFNTPQVNPAALLTFPIIAQHMPYTEGEEHMPMGTGSYKFSNKNSGEIFLEQNNIWHGGEASGKSITVKILKDKKAAADAFNVGEIDVITSGEASPEDETPKMNSYTETVISNRMVFLGFNTANPVLTKAVRHAINGFLDKDKILEQDAYGHGMVAELPVNPDSKVYKSMNITKHSEDYAENLLVSEGYTRTDGFYQKDGAVLSLRLLVNEDNIKRSALSESIAGTLSAAGISIAVEKTDYKGYIDRIYADDFDMFIGETELWDNQSPDAMLNPQDNYFNFDITGLSEAIYGLYGVQNRDIYIEKMGEFSRRFHDNPPYLPLYFRSQSVIYGSYVSGITRPVGFDPYKGIEKWYFYGKDTVGGEETNE